MLYKEARVQKKGWKVSWREEIGCFVASSLQSSYIRWCAAIPGPSQNRTRSSSRTPFAFPSQLHPASD